MVGIYILKFFFDQNLDFVLGKLKIANYREDDGDEWSPFNVCEAYARKKGFLTKKGVAEAFRAANFLLRDALNGRNGMVMSFLPPDQFNRISDEIYEAARDAARRLKPESYAGNYGSSDENGGNDKEDDEDSSSSASFSLVDQSSVKGRGRFGGFAAFASSSSSSEDSSDDDDDDDDEDEKEEEVSTRPKYTPYNQNLESSTGNSANPAEIPDSTS